MPAKGDTSSKAASNKPEILFFRDNADLIKVNFIVCFYLSVLINKV